MKNLLIIILGIAVIVGATFLIVGGNNRTEISEYSSYFMQEVNRLAIDRIGQPIEGFDANLLMMAFPELKESDFNGVETAQGIYLYEDGELTFTNTAEDMIHSAERMISEMGYGVLLGNIVVRLQIPFDSEGDVDKVIEKISEGFEPKEDDKSDLIVITSPIKDQIITSPLNLEGQARGYWFFEASAPVVLTDWDGRIIAESYITADGEWMTTDFVPFTGELEFEKPEFPEGLNYGFIIFKKDNPSGLPENDDALEFRVYFEE